MPPHPQGPEDYDGTRDIVRRARERGADGFRELYERIAPSLVAWGRLRAGGKGLSSSDVEDLLQEIWLRAFEEFPAYDEARSSFRAWIFGIAKNVLYEAWRQGVRRTDSTPSAAASALGAWPDVATTIRTRLARDEAVETLLARAERFDPLDRKLLLHCGFEGMSCAEAARQLGLGAEAASKRWQRLRSRLAERPFRELLELEA